MSDVTLTIDGTQVVVPEGTNVVDAARTVGIDIPVFCYHPRLKSVGMCRMCLVTVGAPMMDRSTGKPVLDEEGNPKISMFPKLQTACTTIATQGMVVETSTEQIKSAQRGILEFLLTSHPLDCPVCDKGGECPLQNLTMEWGPSISRYDYVDKVHFQKPVPLGPLILLDRERCILCGRCVRFQDEIATDPVLGFYNRGRAWHIISQSDPPFDSKFSGNTTDICPVGALTTADFRFRARVWELRPTPSLCLHCSVGCNLTLDMRQGEIQRVMPRENAAVNDIWLCDKGRFGQRYAQSSQRVTTPLVRRGNDLVPVSWDEALQVIADKMLPIYQRKGGEGLAGLVGHHLSNEDLYLFQRLFRDVLGSHNLDHRAGAPGEPQPDDVGAVLGVGSGTNLLHLGKGTTVLVIGADPEEEAPLYRVRLQGIAQRGGTLVVANNRPTKLEQSATFKLRYRPGSETQVVRALLSVVFNEVGQKHLTPRTSGLAELRSVLNASPESFARAAGLSEEDIQAVVRAFVEADNGIIVYGNDVLTIGASLLQDIANLALLTGKVGKPNNGLIGLLPGGNTRGVLDMGVRPDRGPGAVPGQVAAASRQRADNQRADDAPRGFDAREMWGAAVEGQIRGMYIMGADPLSAYPGSQKALEELEFLVVQDVLLTPTAHMAHVVLPAAAPIERDGTYTNAERRVQRARKAREAPGQCRPDWAIVQAVATTLLEAMGTASTDDGNTGTRSGKRKKQRAGDADTRPWDYMSVSEVALEIAERVEGYQGITHAALAKTGTPGPWGRQVSESFFYDGTSYDNTEGVGIQYPSAAEKPTMAYSMVPRRAEEVPTERNYPFLVVRQRLLYDADPLLADSLLLALVPAPSVVLNPTDAERLRVEAGAQVQVSSPAGSLQMTARVDPQVPEGCVIIPTHLPDAPLSVLETGAYTRVAVSRA